MRSLVAAALLSSLSSLSATEARFYLGTYTSAHGSKGIYTGTINLETGFLGPIELAVEAVNPSFLAISPNGKFLYAAGETGPHGLTFAYRVEPGGKLTFLNQQDSGGAATCHVSVDSENVFVANYNGGNIACFPITPDGSLGERTALIQFTGSGPNPARQTQPHAHSVYPDPSNPFVYSCDLGTDQIWILKREPQSGTLKILDSAKVPKGGGPRHLAFHPNGRFVYANNEMGLSVTVFEKNPAGLTSIQEISTAPEGITGNTGAEIVCHPSGKWLYVSTRGEDTFTVFSIGTDGRLTWVENARAGVKSPRGFAIDPTGNWLIAAGQNDGKITVLKIDQSTGNLSSTDQSATLGSPVCVLFGAL